MQKRINTKRNVEHLLFIIDKCKSINFGKKNPKRIFLLDWRGEKVFKTDEDEIDLVVRF